MGDVLEKGDMSYGDLLKVEEHLFSYIRVALQLCWHWKVGQNWALQWHQLQQHQSSYTSSKQGQEGC